MAGNDKSIRIASIEAGLNRLVELLGVAAGQVGSADASAKESVAGEDDALVSVFDFETYRAWSVARGVNGQCGLFAKLDGRTLIDVAIHGQGFVDLPTEHLRLHLDAVIQKEVLFVQTDLTAVGLFYLSRAVDVVKVGVGVNDGLYAEAVVLDDFTDLVDLSTWIDNYRFLTAVAGKNATITGEGTGWKSLSEKHPRIIDNSAKSTSSSEEALWCRAGAVILGGRHLLHSCAELCAMQWR